MKDKDTMFYLYRQCDGYILPADGGMTNHRRMLWYKWQDLGLPLPHPVTRRTGLMEACARNYAKHYPPKQAAS